LWGVIDNIIDVYTDALLSAHEMEIVRLQSLLEERAPILNLINKHRELMNDKEQLAISSNDSSRLMARGGGMARDPTRLLREEKLRKRIAKELPRVEVELKKSLEKWEDENGSPMVVNGENYLETLMRVSPVAQSRAATKTPTNTTRPRANTTSSTPHLRGRSKSSIQEMAQKPPVRSKTPAARPKTPSGGQLWSGSAATVGRYDGRSLAATIDRAGSRTPGFGVGRIPQPVGNHASPTRNGRPPLCTFPSGANSPERKETQAPAMLERSSSIVKSKISVFNALGNIPTMHPQRPDPEKQMIPFMRHQMHQNRQDNQQRLSNSTNRSIRSVSPYGDSDANYSGYCDEDGMGGVPNVDTYGRNSYEYDSSVRGSETSASDGRKFSLSTASTLSTLETSGSENWEAFGEDSDGGDEPRTAYPQKSQRGYSVSSGKSVGLVRNAVPSQWNSESAY
jgi:protein regulator of cytokinesis 1